MPRNPGLEDGIPLGFGTGQAQGPRPSGRACDFPGRGAHSSAWAWGRLGRSILKEWKSLSPGLLGTSYPGSPTRPAPNSERVGASWPASIGAPPRGNPLQGCRVMARISQGSSCLATLGWRRESRWDSGRARLTGHGHRCALAFWSAVASAARPRFGYGTAGLWDQAAAPPPAIAPSPLRSAGALHKRPRLLSRGHAVPPRFYRVGVE